MQVIVAKTAGFCFGVKRAVERVYEQIENREKHSSELPIYTYGPIIHNEEVVRDLEQKGVQVLNTEEELASVEKGIVIIRAHGVSTKIYDLLDRDGITVVDATCPFVKKIHRLVREQEALGRYIIITGNKNHPEVEGIRSCCQKDAIILETAEEAENFTLDSSIPVSIVSQTTFNYNKFQELVEKFEKKGYDILVLNTICSATQERQVEASRIASEVDVMIVIGDKKSSNSQKLYEICQKKCKNTYFIQTVGDFNPECVNSVRNVGITAGASTPKQIIEEVHANARIK